jgi:hypothetical protein
MDSWLEFNVNESFTLDIGIDDPIELEYQWQIMTIVG